MQPELEQFSSAFYPYVLVVGLAVLRSEHLHLVPSEPEFFGRNWRPSCKRKPNTSKDWSDHDLG